MVRPCEKNEQCKKVKAANTDALQQDEDHKAALALVQCLRPTTGTLSLRDTCKVTENVMGEKLRKCPMCVKPFKGRKCLSNHLLTVHCTVLHYYSYHIYSYF